MRTVNVRWITHSLGIQGHTCTRETQQIWVDEEAAFSSPFDRRPRCMPEWWISYRCSLKLPHVYSYTLVAHKWIMHRRNAWRYIECGARSLGIHTSCMRIQRKVIKMKSNYTITLQLNFMYQNLYSMTVRLLQGCYRFCVFVCVRAAWRGGEGRTGNFKVERDDTFAAGEMNIVLGLVVFFFWFVAPLSFAVYATQFIWLKFYGHLI